MILQDGKALLDLAAAAESLPQLTDWLEQVLEEIAFPVKASQQIMICADEIAANIAAYAYSSGAGTFSVSIVFDKTQNELTITFTDHGIPFDPFQHETPDTSVPLEQRKIGGLGILVVQRMMDRVEYRRDGDCNVLTIAKCGGKP